MTPATVYFASRMITGSYIYALAFGRDGGTIATGSTDSSVRLWNLNVSSAISRICNLPGNNLTHTQWNIYIQGESYSPSCGKQ